MTDTFAMADGEEGRERLCGKGIRTVQSLATDTRQMDRSEVANEVHDFQVGVCETWSTSPQLG